MSTEWLEVLDRIPNFDLICSTLKQWHSWFANFQRLVRLFDFDTLPNNKKVALLLLKIKNANLISKGFHEETVEFSELVDHITDHLMPTNLRQQFFRRRQHLSESFVDFAHCLKVLSIPCQFKELQDSIVRDIFILNMHESYAEIAKMICERTDPTIDEAVLIATAAVCHIEPSSLGVNAVHVNKNIILASEKSIRHADEHQVDVDTNSQKEKEECVDHENTAVPTKPTVKQTVTLDLSYFEKERESSFNSQNFPIADEKTDHRNGSQPGVDAPDHNFFKRSSSATSFQSSSGRKSLEGTDACGNGKIQRSDGSFRGKQNYSPPPALALGECCSVSVVNKFNDGTLNVCKTEYYKDVQILFQAMNEHYSQERRRKPLHTIKPGFTTCATFIEGRWCRGRVRSVAKNSQKCKVTLSDYWGEHVVDDTGLFFLKKEFFEVPVRTFLIKVNDPSYIEPFNRLDIQVVGEESGVFICELKNRVDVLLSLEPRFEPDSSSSSLPPIPMDEYVTVQVIYKSPQGKLYVCPQSSMDELVQICQEIDDWCSENQPEMKTLTKGSICAAQYNGSWYRAEILSVDARSVNLLYFDFGNEDTVCSDGLVALPPKISGAPRHSFPIKLLSPAVTVGEGDSLEIRLLREETDGTWAADVKETAAGCSNGQKSIPTPVSSDETTTSSGPAVNGSVISKHPWISVGETSTVEILFTSPEDGKLFATLGSQKDKLEEMMQELAECEKIPLPKSHIGHLCLAPAVDEDDVVQWLRAEIIKFSPRGDEVSVKYIDVGHRGIHSVSQLLVLPKSYSDLPPLAFEIKVPGGINVDAGDQLLIKALSCEDGGALVVDVEEVIRPEVVQEVTSSNPPPPIPENYATTVRVVYDGPEGTFVAPCSSLPLLSEIAQKIREIGTATAPFKSPPTVGNLCLAPFMSEYYRAEILSVAMPVCRVAFVDYGNVIELPVGDLRQLPPELDGYGLITFKLPDTISAAGDGPDLTLTPVFEEDGTWTFQIVSDVGTSAPEESASRGNYSPQPCEVPLPPTPVHPAPPSFLSQDSPTNVTIVYVGSEGAFAVPDDKLILIQTLAQRVMEMANIPLKTAPSVGDLCIAPFENGFYRARVLSVHQQNCHVVFVDFGNEIALPVDQLKEIPMELTENIFTFKVNWHGTLYEGMKGTVKPPVSMSPDGSYPIHTN